MARDLERSAEQDGDDAPLRRRVRQRVELVAARAQAERRRHSSVAVAFEVAERDAEVGGAIVAGALAYRLFIWLLPLALVLVAGLGIAADSRSESPARAARSVGFAGLVSHSVADAAESPARWYALLVGLTALVFTTRNVLRALRAANRLVWGDVQPAARRAGGAGTLSFLGLLVAFIAVGGLASAARAHGTGLGLAVTMAAGFAFAGLWLVATAGLPRTGIPWTALLPGAVLFGVGMEIVHVLAAYVLAPYANAKQGTYGALGMAAALLLGLFLIGRLFVLATALNATLWARAHPRRDGG